MFSEMTYAQMLWYQYQFSLDNKEDFELLRYMEEHNAMFSNPEGVQRIREARENKFEMPEEDFKNHIQDLFGRELPNFEDNENIPFNEYLEKQEEKNNIEEYLDMELDSINFIPIG